jgi:hypothetical protein
VRQRAEEMKYVMKWPGCQHFGQAKSPSRRHPDYQYLSGFLPL